MEYLSNSRISLYLQCGLKYKFQYEDKLPKPFKSSGLAFGSAIHAALNWVHAKWMKGMSNGDISLDRLHRIFSADWYAQRVEGEIRYKEGEEESHLIHIGKEMLRMYVQDPHPKIKGSEIPFVVPLIHPTNGQDLGITLEGYFDLIEEDDGIVEFKTSAQTMNIQDAEDHLQLTAYSYAYEMIHGRPPKTLKIVNFVKHKKPKVVTLETSRTKEDYRWFFGLAKEVLHGIREKIFFPRRSFMCKDCEYQEECRRWGG